MKKKLSILVVIIAIFAVIGFFVFKKGNQNIDYEFERLSRGEVTQYINASGTINPVSEVKIGSNVSGLVKKVYVDFNSKVKKGQLLLELEEDMFKYQLQHSSAQLAQAESQYSLAQRDFQRIKELYLKEFASPQEFDKATQVLRSASAQVKLASALTSKDTVNYNYHKIFSPIDGVVVEKSIDEGQVVAANFQAPLLFRIAEDFSNMEIYASVSEADIGLVQEGKEVLFKVDAFPEQEFKGVIKQIRVSPSVQQNVVTYTAIINVINTNGNMLPGMTANVSIPILTKKDVVRISSTAIRYKPDGYEKKERLSVFVVRNNEVVEVPVNIGVMSSLWVEIVDGITTQDNVIVGVKSSDKKPTNIKFKLF